MKLFERREYDTPEEKKLSVVRFWFFVVGIFALIIPLAVLYTVNAARLGSLVLVPSLTIFGIVVVILVIVYFVYRAVLMRNKS
ncbi:MAG: hypothetical protein JW900_11405 [Anaerolineae bacterium]|nr:hypothetical protein [Anaerolineae bacterium]